MAAKQLMTVRGAVACDAESVSWVMPHEHLIHSISDQLVSGSDDTASSLASNEASSSSGLTQGMTEIRLDQLRELRVDPRLYGGHNLRMEREDEIFRELEALCSLTPGSGVIIDVTTPQEGRDLKKLRQLADRVNIHMVASTSLGERDVAKLPEALSDDQKSERLAKLMETELMFGVGESQTDGCVGVINQQIHFREESASDSEAILQRALASTQKGTGAPVFLSFSSESTTSSSDEIYRKRIRDWIASLVAHGASSDRIVLCHADLWAESPTGFQFLVDIARSDVNLSFDLVGLYTVSDVVITNPCQAQIDPSHEPPRDSSIARAVVSLIHDHGLGDRVLVSSGVLQRLQLQRNGGGGYAYALTHFKRRLLERHGVSEVQWDQIARQTPLRLLLWYSPPAAVEIPKHFLKCTICREYFEPIVGEYFTKFQFVYCGTKCLRKHSRLGFKPLD